MTTKQEIIDAISLKLKIDRLSVSTGSTEPRDFLANVAHVLGIIEETKGLTKPEMAGLIATALGQDWDQTCFSAGSTVTKEGLQRILNGLNDF